MFRSIGWNSARGGNFFDLCPATGVFGRNISYAKRFRCEQFLRNGSVWRKRVSVSSFWPARTGIRVPLLSGFGRNASFVVQYRVADDRQSESRSSVFATPTFVDPVETDEYFSRSASGTPQPLSWNGEVVEIVVLGVLLDRDRDAFAGVIDRIVGQGSEDRVKQRSGFLRPSFRG